MNDQTMSIDLEAPARGQRLAAGNFTLTGVLSEGKRQISMTGYVYSDDTPEEINARLDLYQEVMDRQVLRAELKAKEEQIARNEEGIQALAAHYDLLSRKKQSGRKLSSQDLDHLDKYDSSVEHFRQSNAMLRTAIDEGRKRLNGSVAMSVGSGFGGTASAS